MTHSDHSLEMADNGRESAAAALAALEGILHRNAPAQPTNAARMSLLARAQLRGLITYPNNDDTPATVADRGRRLMKALDEGDEQTERELGIRYPQHKPSNKTAKR